MEVVQILIFLIVLGFVFTALFFVVAKIMKKHGSETVDEAIVKNSICGKADCKKCGNQSCAEFAKSVNNGTQKVEECPHMDKDKIKEVKEALGEKKQVNGDKVAFVMCRGGDRASEDFNYEGIESCAYMNTLYNGAKNCKYACLGCMDCAKVCPTKAIFKTPNGVAEIDRTMCIGCGECTKVCPDKLIKMIPIDQEIVPACKFCTNDQVDTNINAVCSVGCNKCGACVFACKYGAISFGERGQLIVDKTKCTGCLECVKVCPNQTIVRQLTDFDKI